MSRERSKPTIRDVAEASGVSVMTVSHILNDRKDKFSPGTRDRVVQAMQRLNYQPSAVARGLARQRLDTIGVVCYTRTRTNLLKTAFFADALGGILEMAMETGQSTMLFTEIGCQDVRARLGTYCDRRCDGIIFVAPPDTAELVGAMRKRDTPYLLLSDQTEDPKVAAVDIDNVGAADMAVTYLIEQGHRQIAFFGGDETLTSAHLRLRGYRDALLRAGLEADEALIVPGLYTEASGYARAIGLLGAPGVRRPTAIFCANDEIAVGVARALQELRIGMPQEISLVGFDDSGVAAGMTPALTTVRQPLYELGKQAVLMLVAQLRGDRPAADRRLLLPAELIARDSVAVQCAR